MIRHLVAVRFKDGVSGDAKDDVFEMLGALRGHLGGISDYQVRRNVSPEEPVVHGFLDLFWFDFEDASARDTYLVDPEHQVAGGRLVGLAEGGMDGIQVLDFEV